MGKISIIKKRSNNTVVTPEKNIWKIEIKLND